MRKVITNNEQSTWIKHRRPFGTRFLNKAWNGDSLYVYEGFRTHDGYECWHWNTMIAKFYDDGRVFLEHNYRSATTNRYRSDIVSAMTPEERIKAYQGIARSLHAEARRYPVLFSSRHYRELLSRYDWALDVDHKNVG